MDGDVQVNSTSASGQAGPPDAQSPEPATIDAPAPETASTPTEAAKETTATPAKAKAPRSRARTWLRRVGIGALVGTPIAALGLWIAIHRVEWLGPWLADTGRSIVGNDAIAKLEDWAYGVQDEYNQMTRGDEAPEARWEIPELPPSLKDENASKIRYPRFVPETVGPMHTSFKAPGDGEWVPMVDPRQADEPPPMWKTLLHPDKKRGWALVAVVAMDLRQIRLHLVAGTMEPMTQLKDAKAHKRTGVIPDADVATALAAFNGGFKTTHGNYGMKAEGTLFVEPRGRACTVAAYDGDVLKIGSWEALENTRDDMVWFRQAPMCMYEDGTMHKGLLAEENTLWGSTLDKDTVIRRSAIGLSQDQKTLYVGISEATTATAIAKAMNHAGAHNVAQLDVNWSYPKFVTVEPKNGDAANPTVKAIVDGFEYTEDDYVRKAMHRDFFYVTRKSPDTVVALTPQPAGTPGGATPEPPAN
ncbi:MAG: hypothetical protein HOW73_37225 [Polyangiaceae bacterium]|nr:hypothetical protein [Polyangiaceae bacterium]